MFIDILCLLSNSDLVDSIEYYACLITHTAIFKISDCFNVYKDRYLCSGFLFFPLAIFFIY
jgi:hypothetical protein